MRRRNLVGKSAGSGAVQLEIERPNRSANSYSFLGLVSPGHHTEILVQHFLPASLAQQECSSSVLCASVGTMKMFAIGAT